jgi:O-antigen/teichoic acid export membrane protein
VRVAQPPSSAAPSRGLRSDFVITISAQVAVAVGGLLLYRLLALEKGAEGMASYVLVKQAVIFLYPAVALGLGTGVPRYVALGRDEEGAGERYLLVSVALTGVAVAVASVGLLVSPRTTASLLFGDASREYLVAPMVATLVATLVFQLVYGYYRGRSEFLMASAAQTLSIAALPVVLLVVIPDEPIGRLISLMAIGVVASYALLGARPLVRALRSLRPQRARIAGRTLLDYGRRRVPGEYATVVLLAVPPLLAAHVAPLREVAYLTAGMYVIAVVTIAFQPVGLVFLPLLSRLCKDDFEEARRWVGRLAACSLHIAIFVTPQLLLFADVALHAWLGPDFEKAGPVIRITVAPVALYIFYLILRSALDAAAVKSYNSRNNVIAVAVAAVAAGLSLGFDLTEPVKAIAASFAVGIVCLGALTLASVHALFKIGTSEYALRASLGLSMAAAGAAALARLAGLGSDASLLSLVAVLALEALLAGVYLFGLTRAGITWPSDIRRMLRGRVAT